MVKVITCRVSLANPRTTMRPTDADSTSLHLSPFTRTTMSLRGTKTRTWSRNASQSAAPAANAAAEVAEDTPANAAGTHTAAEGLVRGCASNTCASAGVTTTLTATLPKEGCKASTHSAKEPWELRAKAKGVGATRMREGRPPARNGASPDTCDGCKSCAYDAADDAKSASAASCARGCSGAVRRPNTTGSTAAAGSLPPGAVAGSTGLTNPRRLSCATYAASGSRVPSGVVGTAPCCCSCC
ncbi:hypothetical protein LPJ73_007449 [Coemansia sp. RSA 2703]|nr:hypothetical protein LPJ73_007449 [Coemansia sp. RSA 2703]